MRFFYRELVELGALGDGPLAPDMKAPDGIGGLNPRKHASAGIGRRNVELASRAIGNKARELPGQVAGQNLRAACDCSRTLVDDLNRQRLLRARSVLIAYPSISAFLLLATTTALSAPTHVWLTPRSAVHFSTFSSLENCHPLFR